MTWNHGLVFYIYVFILSECTFAPYAIFELNIPYHVHQVEEATRRLSDISKELEKAYGELRGTQLSLQEAEKRKDEFKGRAQETVRQ